MKRRAWREWEYWGRPVPSFGDPEARVLLLGLAPGAHGSNRTGRMFTGDRSGDILYRVLHKTGFASQPTSQSRDDGLELRGAYITAACHCAPPANKPLPQEIRNCRPYFERELALLPTLKVVVALGKIAFDNYLDVLKARGAIESRAPFHFGHDHQFRIGAGTAGAGELLPSQPAEYIHRQAHREDVGGRFPASAQAGWRALERELAPILFLVLMTVPATLDAELWPSEFAAGFAPESPWASAAKLLPDCKEWLRPFSRGPQNAGVTSGVQRPVSALRRASFKKRVERSRSARQECHNLSIAPNATLSLRPSESAFGPQPALPRTF